jgi:hypothetical protein
MIVLDEQLQGPRIKNAISQWYPGKIVSVIELRPGTVIKDDAIPALLSQESDPTFVTINESDFWLKVPISYRFCVVCIALPDFRMKEVPELLRRLLRHSDYQSKAQRMGTVFRLSATEALFYSVNDSAVHTIKDW